MNIKKIDINKLKPAKYNPRKKLKPGDTEYEKLKRSIEEFGYVEPIIVNKDMTIIGGHQRYTVLKDLGNETIDCVVVDLDKTNEKALNIALNKISGSWDDELLKGLLNELNELDIDIELTGFSIDDIENLSSVVEDKENNDNNENKNDKNFCCPECGHEW